MSVSKNWRWLVVTTCIAALAAGEATAQSIKQPPAPADAVQAVSGAEAAEPAVESDAIVVTASRAGRSGFVAPTPTTVVSAAELGNTGVTNAADLLNRNPTFAASFSPAATGPGVTNVPGANFLNLRGLGAERTLVLVDGRRHVPTNDRNSIDINLIPSLLLDRIEVVTGGASAAWGSDAVSGVVNFILAKKIDGLRLNVQQGISQEGDQSQTLIQGAYGLSMLDDRLHLIVAGEYYRNRGAGIQGSRDWGRNAWNLIVNPDATATNGQFLRLVTPGVQYSNATMGGLITNRTGPLANLQFGPGGTVLPFNYGTKVGSSYMIGGDGTFLDYLQSLEPKQRRVNGFARLTFDVTPDISAGVDVTVAHNTSLQLSTPATDYGNITIQKTNAYLPAEIRDKMPDGGSFRMGRLNFADLGYIKTHNSVSVQRYVPNIQGKLFDTLKWNAYYEYGVTQFNQTFINNRNQQRWAAGIDAVVNPANNQIVCRSTLTNPTNGCVPINVFGVGSISQAAKDYVLGSPFSKTRIREDAAGVNLSGEPFSLWAGPVSIAIGGEYRKLSVDTVVDALSQAGVWRIGNTRAISGGYNVKEGYAEVVVPLARDLSFAKSLEFNGAIRRTDYSTSGGVTSWKAGLSYEPFSGLRFRAARSRDIRAPNISELFLAARSGAGLTLIDPVTKKQTFYTLIQTGNRALTPEQGDTWTYGVVLEPSFAPGLRVSVDAADIKVTNAISTLTAQDTVDRCAAGETQLCGFLQRDGSGAITTVTTPFLNLASIRSRSIDTEIAYRLPLSNISSRMNGSIDLRLLGTYLRTFKTSSGVTTLDVAGLTDRPKYRQNVRMTYENGPFTGFVEDVFIGKSRIFAQYSGLDISDNSVPSRNYINISGTLRINDGHMEVFGVVTNLFNQDPPIVVTGSVFGLETNAATFDTIGRRFMVGVRIR